MTTVHAQVVGDKAVLPRTELDRLVQLARQSEEVSLELHEDDILNLGILMLAERGGAFDWLNDEENLYSVNDLKVRYR